VITLSRRSLLLAAAAAIPARTEELGAGKLLVATQKSRDPDLEESVILLIQFSSEGVIGLMLNRPTRMPVARLFPDLKTARGEVYDGGPIDLGIRGLLRTRSKPIAGERVFGDVYLVGDRKAIEGLAAAGASARRFRVYSGYTGWTPGQLKNEVASGLWQVTPPDAAVVFDPDPTAVWSRLIG